MDHYKTLGVDKSCTQDDIKKAYRRLASIHHPDKGGNTATFQQIQAAYEILSNPQKRSAYDNPQQNSNPGFSQGFPGGFNFQTHGFDEFFGNFFRNHHDSEHSQKTKQVFKTILLVSLEQLHSGGSQVVQLQTHTGLKTINIDIPKGIPEGFQIRLNSIIEEGSLIVEFRSLKHSQFERHHNDLVSTLNVSVLDLITGTNIVFKTLSGVVVEVTIPPKTQPHVHLRLAGKGLPVYNTEMFGDQILLIKPYIPDIIPEIVTNAILQSQKE